MSSQRYDLAVIGSGPAGQKAAIAAAKLGKRVALADRSSALGGVSLHKGTIPSKTLRESVLHLTGLRHRAFYGDDYHAKKNIRVEDLALRVGKVVEDGRRGVRDQLVRNKVELLDGHARFLDPHTLEVGGDAKSVTVEAEHVLIACGTRPARPDNVPFQARRVLDSDDIVAGVEGDLPHSAIVVGAGVIGLEYTSMMAALGIKVTVIEARDSMLAYVDHEITEALSYHLRRLGVTFRLGEKVESIQLPDDRHVVAQLESGKTVKAERLLYAIGRQANTDLLKLDAIGIEADKRGHLEVNKNFQTAVPHIYAAGDVIGHPSLASTSMEQGRLAACHMFGAACEHRPELLPYGIYTIPEISMVGPTERQLTEKKIPYEVGLGRFEEVARAQIVGDRLGLLKLLFDPSDLKLLGVHVMGESAAELVHIGQMVMASGGTIETLRDTVFNYPTMAEVYKTAAINGLNRLNG